ncbi:MAG: Gfo/Idh/MocA family oxidoreductase, partial [Bacteroidetes bacterium]|nr:Gfo/Idh/MocA family oxidoreductase [Bacteroidota bacterium]
MNKKEQNSRRLFLKKLGGTTALVAGGPLAWEAAASTPSQLLKVTTRVSANSRIRVAMIGMGIMGFGNARTALQAPGVELAAVCDLYDGHLIRAKEVFGKDIFTTRSYKEVLERKDIDAVIISTPDHWHDKISIDAMKKGKAVYCEKPMVQQLEEGLEVIDV